MPVSSVQVQLLVMCTECGASTPVNGVADSVLCSTCQHPIQLTQHNWLGLLDDFVEQGLLGTEGEIQDTKVLSSFGEFTIWYGRCRPICPSCDSKLSEEELQALKEPACCPSCGKPLGVRVPAPWFGGVCPDPRYLVAETLEAPRAEVETDEGALTIFCMSCGGTLEISGDKRAVECQYCQSENFIPDQIWLRLHPAATKAPWYIVANQGPLGTALPTELDDFCDLGFADDGGLVLAYIEEYVDTYDYDGDEDSEDSEDSEDDDPSRSRVLKLDGQGTVVWKRDDIEFDRDAALVNTPDGATLAVIVKDERFVWLDPATGATIGEVVCQDTVDEEEHQPPEDLRPLQLYNSRGVQLDVDGTVVVLRCGPADDVPVFTRYDARGQPLPMWPPPQAAAPAPPAEAPEPAGGIGGFFRGLMSSKPVPPPEPERYESPGWDGLTDRLLIPPDGAGFRFAPDGVLVLLARDGRHLARYDRQGKRLESRHLEALPAGSLGDFGVTADGGLYQVFMPEQYWEDVSGAQLLHYPAQRDPQLVLGARVEGSPYLGSSEPNMKVHPAGRFYLGYGTDGLRVVTLDGHNLFRTPSTVRMDVFDERRREEAL